MEASIASLLFFISFKLKGLYRSILIRILCF
jgi:hypothetical protein